MKDPFTTLGVSSTSSEDEIKRAYRKLAKEYHPDLHPGDKKAEEKMKELNEAYAEAIRVKKNGSYNPDMYGERANARNPYGGQNPFGGQNPYGAWNPFGPFQTQGWNPFGPQTGYQESAWNPFGTSTQTGSESDPRLQAAMDFIRQNRFQEALNVLQGMQGESARWHYLNALAHKGLGNQVAAFNHIHQAVNMDPGNEEYRHMLNQMQGTTYQYRQRSGPASRGICYTSPLLSCLMFNMLARCLCGGRGFYLCC